MADVRRLPVPVTDIWDWQMHGACRGMNSDLFFHPERERGPARAVRERRAKNVCGTCPVLERCRQHALAVREPYGVWGGLSVAERDEIIQADEDRGDTIRAGHTRADVIGADFAAGPRRGSPMPASDRSTGGR